MSKRQLDYKLVNLVLLVLLIYLVYQTRSFWLGVVSMLKDILLPFFIAFIIAYAIYPLIASLTKRNVPKALAMIIVIGGLGLIFGLLGYLIFPVFTEQIGSLFNGIITFFKELAVDYNINFSMLQKQLSGTFDETLENIGNYISDGAIDMIGASFSIISNFFIIIAAVIYFLIDMEKIRNGIRKFVIRRNKKFYLYLSLLDKELNLYLSGFIKIVIISFFEYLALYSIIGHPNALMLGTLAAFGNLIPYFGGIITNIIAAITAFVISPELFVKTIIIFVIFSAVDGYVINPFVYGKTNKVHPLVVIISVFAGGIIGGIVGIIFALPTAIVILATIKFYKEDINKFSKRKLKVNLEKKG
ncbi:MAG: AI-2E family transporter [Bacilli bacterium]|nr:AI-2E family transporter [Bacilli bacterium]